ncbi:MAG: RidA family protein [Alphaproteobacteria bacterium]|nr:RidA family protein [Alphaproteobacteria bacterium]MBO6628320.1 RidA family protein [Alphaproteobacteria bacterium]MDF1624706.1 RidA family protein [Parvibaculaceae bacterium]
MADTISTRLTEIGITLPKASGPAGTYAPFLISGNLVYISGQVPLGPKGLEFQGKLGDKITNDEGKAAARLCAVNILAQLSAALDGKLDRVTKCVKLGGFVNSTPEFGDHPAIVNGASDLMVEVFGDKGRHARFAIGVSSLPFNVAVEVEAIFEIA